MFTHISFYPLQQRSPLIVLRLYYLQNHRMQLSYWVVKYFYNLRLDYLSGLVAKSLEICIDRLLLFFFLWVVYKHKEKSHIDATLTCVSLALKGHPSCLGWAWDCGSAPKNWAAIPETTCGQKLHCFGGKIHSFWNLRHYNLTMASELLKIPYADTTNHMANGSPY